MADGEYIRDADKPTITVSVGYGASKTVDLPTVTQTYIYQGEQSSFSSSAFTLAGGAVSDAYTSDFAESSASVTSGGSPPAPSSGSAPKNGEATYENKHDVAAFQPTPVVHLGQNPVTSTFSVTMSLHASARTIP